MAGTFERGASARVGRPGGGAGREHGASGLALAALTYLLFLVSQAWLFVFVAAVPAVLAVLPCPLPSVDTVCIEGVRRAVDELPVPSGAVGMLGAAAWDTALFAVWGLVHSLMARPWFKARWTRIVPPHLERSVYVLVAAIGLCLVLAAWQPLGAPLWRAEGALRSMLVAASLIGFGIATWATFLVDHLALFGLRPVLERQGWLAPRADTFVQPAVYRWVRHPMMTGVLLGIWAMPDVSAGRILLAVLVTAYVIVGTHFEERELLRRFGEPYAAYRARTGRFFPRPW